MKQQDAPANRGFSLIELVIVITIMVVLTSLLAPQVLRYVEQSRIARDEQNIDEIYRVIQLALTDETAYNAVMKACSSGGTYWLYIRNSQEITTRGMVVQGTGSAGTATPKDVIELYSAICSCMAGTKIESNAVIFPIKYRFSSNKYNGKMYNNNPALTIKMTESNGALIITRIAP